MDDEEKVTDGSDSDTSTDRTSPQLSRGLRTRSREDDASTPARRNGTSDDESEESSNSEGDENNVRENSHGRDGDEPVTSSIGVSRFGGNDDLSTVHADVDIVLDRCDDVLRLCNQVSKINVASIPHFRDALIAFMDNLRSQQDILKEFTGLNDRVDSNLRSCILVLVQAHKLLIDVKQNSTSIFFRGKRYKNKISVPKK